jgi:hypothetical protein
MFSLEREYATTAEGGLLPRLLNSDDPFIISDTMLLTVHLLWDSDWQRYIFDLNPRLEVIAVRWAAAAVTSIEKEATRRYNMYQMQIDLQLSLRSHPAKLAQLKKRSDWVERPRRE